MTSKIKISERDPDVRKTCLFLVALRTYHFEALKRVLKCIKDTYSLCLHLNHSNHYNSCTDEDWATDQDDRRFVRVVCVCILWNLGVIVFKEAKSSI